MMNTIVRSELGWRGHVGVGGGVFVGGGALATTVAIVISAVATVQARARTQYVQPDQLVIPTLEVSGSATVEAAADRLIIELSVTSEDASPAAALDDNAARVDTVLKTLQESATLAGLIVHTGRYRMSRIDPDDDRRPRPLPGAAEGAGAVEGEPIYRVTHDIIVESHQLDLAGRIIQAAVEAGADAVESVRFTVEDTQTHRSRAMRDATDRARRDAETLAQAAGVTLVRIVHVEAMDTWIRDQEIMGYAAFEISQNIFEDDAGAPELRFQPDSVQIGAEVFIRYEIVAR